MFEFAAKLVIRLGYRLAYGAMLEKAWRVSTASLQGAGLTEFLDGALFPSPRSWRNVPVPSRYSFYADPFYFRSSGGIVVEALNRRSGLGEIVLLANGEHRSLIREHDHHLSYPATATVGGREVLVPETARWSPPRVYAVQHGGVRLIDTLRIHGDARVTDPSLLERDARVYLFGNTPQIGSNVLQLWLSYSLEHEFALHPASPIRIGPEGSRMGGSLIEAEGRLFRLGQDSSRGYGDGLIIFEITQLTPDDYAECRIGTVRFQDRKGPHTLNVHNRKIVFDWYRDRFTLMAGIRRLLGRRNSGNS